MVAPAPGLAIGWGRFKRKAEGMKKQTEHRARVQRIIEIANAEAERRTAEECASAVGYKIRTIVKSVKINAIAERLAHKKAEPTKEEIEGCLQTVLVRGHGGNL